jgi:hypothetical protein
MLIITGIIGIVFALFAIWEDESGKIGGKNGRPKAV